GKCPNDDAPRIRVQGSRDAMTALRLLLLGDFQALDGAGRPVQVSAKKSRAVLAILALSDSGSVSRQRLANLLWGDRGDEPARARLRQTLPSLRRDSAPAAETILSADDDVVAINRPHVGADVVDFERLAPSEEVGDLHLAIGLYRGDLLTDLAVSEP